MIGDDIHVVLPCATLRQRDTCYAFCLRYFHATMAYDAITLLDVAGELPCHMPLREPLPPRAFDAARCSSRRHAMRLYGFDELCVYKMICVDAAMPLYALLRHNTLLARYVAPRYERERCYTLGV